MGKRGPKKTPTIILRKRGSWLANTRKDEPEMPAGVPECPSWLRGEAKQEWDRVVTLLQGRGILTKADGGALVCLCMAWLRFVQAESVLSREGLVVTTITGGTKAHPCVAISSTAWSQYIKACSLFGLSPADRSNVAPAPQQAYDDALADQGALLLEELKKKGVLKHGRRSG